MDNLFSFFKKSLKKSNRYKHLIGGFIVGLCALSPLSALYASAVAASCLELKDKLHGYLWNWIDWATTIAGGSIAALLLLLSFLSVRHGAEAKLWLRPRLVGIHGL